MTVITISRQTGSGGDEIAAMLCDRLNYLYFDKKMLARFVAQEYGEDVDFLQFSEEDFVQGKDFFNRFVASFGDPRPAAEIRSWREDPSGLRSREVIQLDQSKLMALIQSAIRYAADHGDMIVVGRGGQVLLRDHHGALHVRIEAPLEKRIQRIKAQYHIDRREAETLIMKNDDASADYLRRYYDVNVADTSLYHLVLNTGMVEPDAAVQIILEAVRMVVVPDLQVT